MSQNTSGLAPSVILVGMGEIGQVLAAGFLKTGHPVIPLTRRQSLSGVLAQSPDAQALVLAVGEKDLPDLLTQIPAQWHERLVLIQNELLPKDWQSAGIVNPTVMSIWFEKKPGKLVKQLMPSPVWGRNAGLMAESLAAIGLNARIIDDLAAMQNELVIKNVYILTTNIAGLKMGGDVETLWREHQPLARAVALEVIALQEKLVGLPLAAEPLIEGMLAGFEGDPAHACQGRTAAARLQRALKLAERFGLDLPVMKEIAAAHIAS
ncbi:hypothetical protein [Halothiobacillus sp.]|uniref:hypothetical protein n=1 Tax=Halothiobacillus sp. TaxID=1891311 RepID=UPI002619FBEA|nr:hypothetical protein [Halothiobacillus sp.]